jgi:hypothetical protein
MKGILQRHTWLGSSANPDKVSLTISSAVRLLVAVAALSGIDIDGTEIESALLSIWVGVESVLFLFGLARKVYIKVRKR